MRDLLDADCASGCCMWRAVEIILLMSEWQDCSADEVKLCECHFCRYQPASARFSQPSDVGTPNSMGQFIKLLPVGFPLAIEQTVILHAREDGSAECHSYSSAPPDDRKKFGIFYNTLKSVNSLQCQNVQVYFPNSERILARFEASAVKGAQYVQPHQHNPIIRIQYPGPLEGRMDSILREYLGKEMERVKDDSYRLNEEFLEWVFREYGEDTFFYFLTDLYARLFRALTGGELTAAVFFWVAERSAKDLLTVQKKGGEREKYNSMQELGRPQRLQFRPKLVNVRGLQVRKMEKLFSFEEEYQSLIKQRIASSSKKTITAVKNKAYRGRLELFRSKIQDVYKQEQKAIMSGIEEEKAFEFQVDSQKMARLLIPTLGPDQNLRQVLNDEETFKQVFFSKKKDRHFTTLPTLTRVNFGSKNNANITRRLSTKRNPEVEQTASRVKRRYQKLLTTPSTHE